MDLNQNTFSASIYTYPYLCTASIQIYTHSIKGQNGINNHNQIDFNYFSAT